MDKNKDYPVLTKAVAYWFMDLIESMVSNPSEANFGRVKAGNDLELAIVVDPEDEHIFTPEVCAKLKIALTEKTGVLSPVVYLESNPHPEALESMRRARIPT